MELALAVLGLAGTLLAVLLTYLLHERSAQRWKVVETVCRALMLSREYQYDLREFGVAFVGFGRLPTPEIEDDPEAAREFGFRYNFETLTQSLARLRETERELRRLGVDLMLHTPLYRQPGDVASGFDVIIDEFILGGQDSSLHAVTGMSSVAEVDDLVFRYGVILAHCEEEVIAYCNKRLGRRFKMPEHIAIGAPLLPDEEAEAPGGGVRPQGP